jgi:WhiB family redox-sensing transcriptional regulator
MNADLTEQAVCRTVGTALFFPEVGHEEQYADAKAVCAVCPVKDPCLQDALDGDEYGVWGGTSEAERRQMRDQDPTRSKPRSRSHCPKGHPVTEGNVIYTKGYRYCAICYHAAQARNMAAQRARRAQQKSAA